MCVCFSCPYFRNEVGGEGETVISLTRETGKLWGAVTEESATPRPPTHTPRQVQILVESLF